MDFSKSVKVGAVLIFVMLLVLVYQNRQINALEEQLKDMQSYAQAQDSEVKNLKNQLDILKSMDTSPDVETPWFWEASGYPGTPQGLLSSLSTAEDLIPFDGVLGGTPFFVPGEAILLDEHYVYAPFEDGHVMGGVLLEYSFAEDGEVVWTYIDGWWPEM